MIKNKNLFLAIVAVIISITLVFCSCSSQNSPETDTQQPVEVSKMTELGEGSKTFIFQVHDEEGHITPFVIKTEKATIGEALEELGIIEGTEGAYGLYVKTVNGITADYETTGTYWAFYVGDAYASAGIDMTEIVNGKTYSLRIEE